jgi:hypothetical protein
VNSITYNLTERNFFDNNEVLDRLSKKYSYTIFDFAQAKKEAHLKALK